MRKSILLTLVYITFWFAGCSSSPQDLTEAEVLEESITEEPTKVEELLESTKEEKETVEEKDKNKQIEFEYFYRGFTPVGEDFDDADLKKIVGGCLILSQEDWTDFEKKYCYVAGALSTPDFNEKCFLVEFSLYGSRPSANTSFEIESVEVSGKYIRTNVKKASASDINAINSYGLGHLFMNIITLNRSDIPEDVENMIYKKD